MQAEAETHGTGEAEVRAGIQQGAGKDSEGARLDVREQDRDRADLPHLEAEGGTDREGLFAPADEGRRREMERRKRRQEREGPGEEVEKTDKKKKKPGEPSSPSEEPKMKKTVQNKLRDKKKTEESSSSESEGSSSSESK